MTDKVLALVAYAVMAAFLVILLIYVPRYDLAGVVIVTLLLAGWDTLQVMRSHQRPGHETHAPHDPRDDI